MHQRLKGQLLRVIHLVKAQHQVAFSTYELQDQRLFHISVAHGCMLQCILRYNLASAALKIVSAESPSTPEFSSSSPGPNAPGLSSPEVSAGTSNVSGCLYTTYMEHYGSAQQLAVTNMETAVIVASFDSNVTALPASAVELQLDNGQNGTVSDVQPFPGQANVFLIEVCMQTF